MLSLAVKFHSLDEYDFSKMTCRRRRSVFMQIYKRLHDLRNTFCIAVNTQIAEIWTYATVPVILISRYLKVECLNV